MIPGGESFNPARRTKRTFLFVRRRERGFARSLSGRSITPSVPRETISGATRRYFRHSSVARAKRRTGALESRSAAQHRLNRQAELIVGASARAWRWIHLSQSRNDEFLLLSIADTLAIFICNSDTLMILLCVLRKRLSVSEKETIVGTYL